MRKELYNDSIGYVELLDFSRANMSEENRINYIQQVASICYKAPAKTFDTETGKGRVIYDRLYKESLGLPSSSFELCPILLSTEQHLEVELLTIDKDTTRHTVATAKYGEWIEDGKYLLTNLRALLADVGEDADKFFNTSEEEIAIIKKHFKVFKSKIPVFTARQFMRHRCSWQELSRRYVSGSKYPLEVYTSPKLKNADFCDEEGDYPTTLEEIYLAQLMYYNDAVEQGVKPQDARQVLPQSMYTEMYSAWYPSQLKSMLDLRTQEKTQEEFRELATAMKELVKEGVSNN